jgi:hypothetical protein
MDVIRNAIAITLVDCHHETPIVGFLPFTIPHPGHDVKNGTGWEHAKECATLEGKQFA